MQKTAMMQKVAITEPTTIIQIGNPGTGERGERGDAGVSGADRFRRGCFALTGDDRVDLLDVLQLEELQKLALALDPAELEVETARQQEESRDGSEGVPDPQEPLADHLVDAAHHRSGGGGGGSSVWGASAVPCFRCS